MAEILRYLLLIGSEKVPESNGKRENKSQTAFATFFGSRLTKVK